MPNPQILNDRIFSGDIIVIRDLIYIRTYSIEEFKETFNVPSVQIKLHPNGFLYFPFKNVFGLVTSKGIPQNPRISIVVGKFGVPHYILHEDGVFDKFITVEKSSKPQKERHRSNMPRIGSFWEYEQEKMFEDYDHDPIDDWAYENPPEGYE